MKKEHPCPCHSGKEYADCCEPFHQGEAPASALLLMRSRYSGYALGLVDYIIATTHPLNPHYQKEFNAWRSSIVDFSQGTRFTGLKILDSKEEGESAVVTFIAYLEQNQQDASFQETSLFEKVDGRWLYKDRLVSSRGL